MNCTSVINLSSAMKLTILCTFCLFLCLHEADGHGRLIDPPGRSTMWRYGFATPANYDDNALYCGGFNRQWNRNNGRCGVCGDPYDGLRENEAGGRFATGTIAKRYRPNQVINVAVELTRSHLGWFEFRLCPNNNPRRRVTQQCLSSNLLQLTDGSTRYQVTSWTRRIHQINLRLPRDLTCSQCVLQWKYNAGNSWGCYGKNTHCCIGCGHQEQFYGCADVAIQGSTSYLTNGGTNNNNYNKNTGINTMKTPDRSKGLNLLQVYGNSLLSVGESQNSGNRNSLGRPLLSLFKGAPTK